MHPKNSKNIGTYTRITYTTVHLLHYIPNHADNRNEPMSASLFLQPHTTEELQRTLNIVRVMVRCFPYVNVKIYIHLIIPSLSIKEFVLHDEEIAINCESNTRESIISILTNYVSPTTLCPINTARMWPEMVPTHHLFS